MKYLVVENGVITNIIVADEMFAESIGALPYYDGANAGDEYFPGATPAKKREKAYNTETIISWNGEMITVTEAATLWQYYAAEGSENATTLQTLIADAKATIREKYPYEGVSE